MLQLSFSLKTALRQIIPLQVLGSCSLFNLPSKQLPKEYQVSLRGKFSTDSRQK